MTTVDSEPTQDARQRAGSAKTKDLSGKVRHPEKAHKPDNPVARKPDWIRVKAPTSREYQDTKKVVRQNNLHTVCEEAGCPNIGECWAKGHATMMIMGETCTRACTFCNVATGKPEPLDPFEPARVGDAVAQLGVRARTLAHASQRRPFSITLDDLCEELIERDLDVYWGINTRVTDILKNEEYLPLFRKAGMVHVSLGTESATQLGLDRFRKETTIEENKRAIKLIQENGMVAEAQFIMGMENETPESIEETFRMAMDWAPDMANWNMYTPWPFAELFEELGDKVEIRDYSKYNFVTPIMKPEAMEREDVLKGVLKCYARFYMRKTFFSYPWIRDPFKRRYMLGCLRAFFRTTVTKRFYDIGRVQRDGFKTNVDLGFDETRILSQEELARIKQSQADALADAGDTAAVRDRVAGFDEGALLDVTARYGDWHEWDLKLEATDATPTAPRTMYVSEADAGFTEAEVLDPTARIGDWHEYDLAFDPGEASENPAHLSMDAFERVARPVETTA